MLAQMVAMSVVVVMVLADVGLSSFAALPAEVRAYSNLMYSDCILILVVLF